MTTVIRWNPFRELAAMQNAMDRFFNDTRRPIWRTWNPVREGEQPDAYTLPLDVYETDSAYTLVASLSGVTADQIDVKLHEDVLTIQAEIPAPGAENTRALLQERFYGRYTRSIRLPQAVDFGAAEATYHEGVLTLALPKAAEAQPRIIPVKTNGHSNN